jgi:hypothetical protein
MLFGWSFQSMEDDLFRFGRFPPEVLNAEIYILEDANCNSLKRDSTQPIESGRIILAGRDVI